MSLFGSGLPAPYWFVEFFKTLGFALHFLLIGILLTGTPFSILLWIFGGVNAKRIAQRFFQQIPALLALGINFAIVPLLFVQVAYAKLFYSATITIAAHWLGVLPLTFLAYCACYLCASRARKEKIWTTAFCACFISVCFLGIGLVFSDVWTLFERPYELFDLQRDSALSLNVLGHDLVVGGSGAASGLAAYWNDPTIFARFVVLLGLSFYAFGFWLVFDANYLYRGRRPLTEEEEYALLEAKEEGTEVEDKGKKVGRKRFRAPIQEDEEKYPKRSTSFACFMFIVGAFISVPSLFEYAIRRLEPVASAAPSPFWWNVGLWGVFVSLGLPIFFLLLFKLFKWSGKTLAVWTTVSELSLVGFFAFLRQTIQNVQLSPYYVPSEFNDPSATQWGPILVFLGVLIFVAIWIGLLIVLMSRGGGKDPGALKRTKKVKKVKKNKDEEEKGKRSVKDETKERKGKVADLTLGSGGISSVQTKKGTGSPRDKQIKRINK